MRLGGPLWQFPARSRRSAYPQIAERLLAASKTGDGHGVPEAVLIDRITLTPLAVGTTDDEFELKVSKRVGKSWKLITYDSHPINWIPTRADLDLIAVDGGPTEIRPTIPPLEVLAARADEINRLLRESRVKDELHARVTPGTESAH